MTKQGRNDICNCGSGKKFKKCCINVGQETKFTLEKPLAKPY